MWKKALRFNDTHIPFHDPCVLDIILQLAEAGLYDLIIIGGDFWDFMTFSRFARPLESKTLVFEYEKGAEWLKKFAATKTKIVFLEGNHEFRMARWAQESQQARDIWELMSNKTSEFFLENLFDFKKLGIEFYPYQSIYMTGALAHTHCVGKILSAHSAYTAKRSYDKVQTSIMIGHTHRGGTYYKTHGFSNNVKKDGAYECFCTCQLKDWYLYGNQARFTSVINDWQNGFCEIDYNTDKKGNFVVKDRIIYDKNHFLYDGKIIEPRKEVIEADAKNAPLPEIYRGEANIKGKKYYFKKPKVARIKKNKISIKGANK